MFAREGVFGVVDPSLVPPPGQLALRLARLIERPGAKSGPRLSRALTRLGPAYLKLGQFLATRPDVVGVAMARDLESLQDRLPPFSQAEAEAVIAPSLERPVAQAFASLGPPVAAASIAQVHRGEVERDGVRRPVAVKVLRPNVAARFRRDLADFFFVAHKAEALFRGSAAAAADRGHQHACRARSRWRWICGWKRRRCPRWRRTRATIRISACRRSTGTAPPTTC